MNADLQHDLMVCPTFDLARETLLLKLEKVWGKLKYQKGMALTDDSLKPAQLLGLNGLFKPQHADAIKEMLSDIDTTNKPKLDILP